MTIEVILQHLTATIVIMMVTVALFDALMTFLQRDEKWLIPLEHDEIITHLIFLYAASGAGYWFGWMIGSALPYSQPHESFVIGCAFGSIATMIVRGQHMMHFHSKRRRQKFNDKYRKV